MSRVTVCDTMWIRKGCSIHFMRMFWVECFPLAANFFKDCRVCIILFKKKPSLEISTNRMTWILIHEETLLQGLKDLFKGNRQEGKRIIRINIRKWVIILWFFRFFRSHAGPGNRISEKQKPSLERVWPPQRTLGCISMFRNRTSLSAQNTAVSKPLRSLFLS